MAPSLPSELVIKIIQHAYYLHRYGREADIKMLGACALVCKQWSSCARRLLFFEVDLRSRGISTNSLFTDLEGPSTYTRSLKITASRQPTIPNFIAILSHFPAIYHLDIFVDSIVELTELEMAQLVALPIKVRALRYCGLGMDASRVLYQLMAVWPSIKFLYLKLLCRLAPPPAERPPFSLYELAMGDGGTSYPEPVLRWSLPPILAGQRGSINIVAITFATGHAYDTLMEYAPYVRSLSLFCPRFPPQDFFERFGALEELTLAGFLTAETEQVEPGVPVLPRTVQHLRLNVIEETADVRRLMSYAVGFVESDLPRLRRVSLNTEFVDGRVFIDLREVCGKKGIELSFCEPRRWWIEYLVRVDHFPREWTIESLYRMIEGN